ncbi:MAG: DUF6033 family protein [Lachnospiraceae bacterium]|nr:DUF6033 family protein [Lachnospiraceae bacterium]
MNMNLIGANAGGIFAGKTGKDPKETVNKTAAKPDTSEVLKNGITNGTTKADDIRTSSENATSKANEAKLSKRAQDFLNDLRERFGDYDFMVGNSNDDLRSMVNGSNKEFSVIFSSEEIEKMAADENYAEEKFRAVDDAVEMSMRINEQFGFESALDAAQGNGNTLSRFGVAIGDDGKVTLFAELEKTADKQKEHLEADADGVQKPVKPNPYAKNDENTVKKTIIQAGSEEELMQKLSIVDWRDVPAQAIQTGERLNFTV